MVAGLGTLTVGLGVALERRACPQRGVAVVVQSAHGRRVRQCRGGDGPTAVLAAVIASAGVPSVPAEAGNGGHRWPLKFADAASVDCAGCRRSARIQKL